MGSRLTTRLAQLPSRRDAEREVGVAFTDPIASGEAHGVAMQSASSSRLNTRRAQLPSRRDAEREVGVAFTDPIASGEAHGVAMCPASSPREVEIVPGCLTSNHVRPYRA
jgi:hypothetical protein